jgi:hypothetical protein
MLLEKKWIKKLFDKKTQRDIEMTDELQESLHTSYYKTEKQLVLNNIPPVNVYYTKKY